VLLDGPLDSAIDEETAADLLATLREALSNVARHAAATRVDVEVVLTDELALRVIDDGRGLGSVQPGGMGRGNMAERAARHGGTCTLHENEQGGCTLEWRIPR
jgi:signal transduction histidine kinase